MLDRAESNWPSAVRSPAQRPGSWAAAWGSSRASRRGLSTVQWASPCATMPSATCATPRAARRSSSSAPRTSPTPPHRYALSPRLLPLCPSTQAWCLITPLPVPSSPSAPPPLPPPPLPLCPRLFLPLQLVRETIRRVVPSTVMLELDESRVGRVSKPSKATPVPSGERRHINHIVVWGIVGCEDLVAHYL